MPTQRPFSACGWCDCCTALLAEKDVLDKQLQAASDERLKLERSLEQIRSFVLDALD